VAARLDALVREGAEWERRNESREGESSSPSADEYESATAALLLAERRPGHRPEQRSEWSGSGLNHSIPEQRSEWSGSGLKHSMSDSAHPYRYGGAVSAHGGANASAARHAGALAEEVSTLRQVTSELEAYAYELELQVSDLEKQLDAARSELERRAVYGGRTRDDDEPSRRAAKLAFELEISREEAAELQGRVNSLSAANDALTQTNASLSEQVR
jgi:hypothetical protein